MLLPRVRRVVRYAWAAQMIANTLLAIIVFGLMGALTFGLSVLVPKIFDSLPAVILLRRKIEAKQKIEFGLAQKVEAAKQDRKGVDDELTKTERDNRVLAARKSLFPPDKPLPVVEIGTPVQTNKMYEVFVHNTSVRRARRTETVPGFNPFWEEPRYVIVWAEDLSEARSELNNAYPSTKEWHVEFRGEVTL